MATTASGKHLGKNAAAYVPGALRYTDVRPVDLDATSLPTLTKKFGGGYGTDFSDWLMLGNGPCDDGSITSGYAENGAGDCAWAGPAHEEMESAHNAGRTVPKFTCANILDQYAAYLGLKDHTQLNENNDGGSNVHDVLTHRQQVGLKDVDGNAYKIGPFVQLETGNLDQYWEALYLFENVGIGIQFPESADEQFGNGQAWSVVPGAQIVGGHYIPLVGHPAKNTWTCVTWAKRQPMTQQFVTKYVDEAWAYIDPERYNSVTGETLENYKDADLEKYISLVTKVK